MATRLEKALINSFAGGLNVYSNATQVKDDESPDLMNVEFSGIGSVRKRRGYTKLTTSEVSAGDKIQGIFSYKTSSANEILYISDGVLYKYDGSGGSTAVTGGTFSTTAMINAAQVGDRLYFYDGVTALSYYNGTSISTTGVTAAPTYATNGIYFNRRQYINNNSQRDRVYYSKALTSAGASTDTGDFTSGTDAGFFGFGMGFEVVGFARLSNSLYVFCRKGIFRIDPVVSSGTLDHNSTVISNSLGCRAARSIDNVENDIYFLDSTIFSLGEVQNFISLRTTNISARISKIFQGMSQQDIDNAAGIYYSEEEVYLLAINTLGGGYNDTVIGYSLPYKAWFKWDGFRVNHWLEFISSDNVKFLYFGSDDASSSYIYRAFNTVNDDGAAIDAYYFTKEFDMKQFDIEKLFQFWSVQFGGVYGDITVDFLVDGVIQDSITLSSGNSFNFADGWGSLPWGVFPWGLDFNSPEASASDPGLNNDWRYHDLGGLEGTTFQFKFSNNNIDQSFEIKQATVAHLKFGPYKRQPEREV